MQQMEAAKAIKVPEKLINTEKTLAAQQRAAEQSGESLIAQASKEKLAKLSRERTAQDAAKAAELKKQIAKQFGIRA